MHELGADGTNNKLSFVEDPLLMEKTTDDGSIVCMENKRGMPLREQDRFLPIANIAKIMKNVIPVTGRNSNDAKKCVQQFTSEFISIITSEANDRCHMENRKKINGDDILYAMMTLGFDNYVQPLKIYLEKCREVLKSNKNLQSSIITSEEEEMTVEEPEQGLPQNYNESEAQ